MADLFTTTGAYFSPCRRYRYKLWRIWGPQPMVNFIMLNPSTADEEVNDPTVERCERRARRLGYGGLLVTNLFALRATDPLQMKRAEDPVGPENDRVLVESAEACLGASNPWFPCQGGGLVICAWGGHGTHQGRSAKVRKLLSGVDLHYLRAGKNGEPGHPLYVAYLIQPKMWRAKEGR
jgi:hypothetical protein